jgi:hypothetical protein
MWFLSFSTWTPSCLATRIEQFTGPGWGWGKPSTMHQDHASSWSAAECAFLSLASRYSVPLLQTPPMVKVSLAANSPQHTGNFGYPAQEVAFWYRRAFVREKEPWHFLPTLAVDGRGAWGWRSQRRLWEQAQRCCWRLHSNLRLQRAAGS